MALPFASQNINLIPQKLNVHGFPLSTSAASGSVYAFEHRSFLLL